MFNRPKIFTSLDVSDLNFFSFVNYTLHGDSGEEVAVPFWIVVLCGLSIFGRCHIRKWCHCVYWNPLDSLCTLMVTFLKSHQFRFTFRRGCIQWFMHGAWEMLTKATFSWMNFRLIFLIIYIHGMYEAKSKLLYLICSYIF